MMHFIESFNRAMRKAVKGISPEALDRTVAYDWPGNVRELRNVIERAMLLGTAGMITTADLSLEAVPVTIAPGTSQEPEKLLGPEGVDLGELERRLVAEAIRRTEGNQTQAARLLRLSRDQLRYRLEKFGLLHRGKRSVDKGN